MKLHLAVIAAITTLLASTFAMAQDLSSPAPEGAQVYIVSPVDGATVGTEVTVVFGLKGMGIAPAGVEAEHTGHHHLLVDQAELPAPGLPMGSDVLHFGKGQTQTTITLEPGEHTLQMVLGNHLHVPHTPAVVSEKITITVKAP